MYLHGYRDPTLHRALHPDLLHILQAYPFKEVTKQNRTKSGKSGTCKVDLLNIMSPPPSKTPSRQGML